MGGGNKIKSEFDLIVRSAHNDDRAVAVVVVQLAEWLLPTPEVRSSSPVVSNFLFSVNCSIFAHSGRALKICSITKMLSKVGLINPQKLSTTLNKMANVAKSGHTASTCL